MPGAKTERRQRRQRRQAAQQRFWSEAYRAPDFFGPGPSAFARWALPYLQRSRARKLLELGAGYGRDLPLFRREGMEVRGVDLVAPGRRSPTSASHLQQGEALATLRSSPKSSWDVVYSHLFLNMDFTTPDLREILREVHRVLRPGGLHVFSVRSTNDRWYGRGRRVGQDRFDLRPQGPVLHFFSERFARRLLEERGRFEVLRMDVGQEGGPELPMQLLYVAARRSGSSRAGPRAPTATPRSGSRDRPSPPRRHGGEGQRGSKPARVARGSSAAPRGRRPPGARGGGRAPRRSGLRRVGRVPAGVQVLVAPV